jgi:hypothetical protein
MSMIKVPLLLLNAYLSDRAYTAPTSPPNNELVKDGEKASTYRNVVPALLELVKVRCDTCSARRTIAKFQRF